MVRGRYSKRRRRGPVRRAFGKRGIWRGAACRAANGSCRAVLTLSALLPSAHGSPASKKPETQTKRTKQENSRQVCRNFRLQSGAGPKHRRFNSPPAQPAGRKGDHRDGVPFHGNCPFFAVLLFRQGEDPGKCGPEVRIYPARRERSLNRLRVQLDEGRLKAFRNCGYEKRKAVCGGKRTCFFAAEAPDAHGGKRRYLIIRTGSTDEKSFFAAGELFFGPVRHKTKNIARNKESAACLSWRIRLLTLENMRRKTRNRKNPLVFRRNPCYNEKRKRRGGS